MPTKTSPSQRRRRRRHRSTGARAERGRGRGMPPAAQSAGQVVQHWPLASLGLETALVHSVGKHQTSLQKVLDVPPWLPVAPVMASSSLMSGLTQYGQQWPSTSVTAKPPGQVRAPQLMAPQASLMAGCVTRACTCTSILVFMSLSKATTRLPSAAPACACVRAPILRSSISLSSTSSWSWKPSWMLMSIRASSATRSERSGEVTAWSFRADTSDNKSRAAARRRCIAPEAARAKGGQNREQA
mmetsp:Transcript_43528/g.110234  ORF Transcript_43528/g.110234 Transcript_43528/m.110234 type:complete len:243 (-) Transcript_43528:9-737(-)